MERHPQVWATGKFLKFKVSKMASNAIFLTSLYILREVLNNSNTLHKPVIWIRKKEQQWKFDYKDLLMERRPPWFGDGENFEILSL